MPNNEELEELKLQLALLTEAVNAHTKYMQRVIDQNKEAADATHELVRALQREVGGHEAYPGLKGHVVTAQADIVSLKRTDTLQHRFIVALLFVLISSILTLYTTLKG